MKDLRRASILVAILAGAGSSVAALTVGCSNDETGTLGDASSDVTTSDHHAPEAGQPDVTTPSDGGHDTGHDSGHDSGQDGGQDSGFDSGHDGGHDGGHDSGHDAGVDVNIPPFEAGTDAAGAVEYFQNQINEAFCGRIAQCCNTPATFSVAKCVATFASVGGAVGNVGLAVPNSGNLTLSPSDVSNCIATIQALPCATTTSQEFLNAIQVCAAGLKGTLALGKTGCKSAWDCEQPAYCKPGTDGGTCTTLITANQPCTDTDFSTDCQSLGDVPGLFCGPFGSANPTCLADEALGGICTEDQQCLTTFCGENDAGTPACVSSEVFAPAYCVGIFTPDAG